MSIHRSLSRSLIAGVLGISLAACKDGGGGVTPGDLPPVAHAQQLSTAEDVALGATLSAEDPEGGPLVFSIVEPPRHGAVTATDAASGRFTYAPAPDYFGEDGFSFKVTDGHSESAPALVTVTVTPVNDPPSATAASIGSGPYGTDATIKVTVSGWLDVENDPEGYVYHWYVNDVLVPAATTDSLAGVLFAKHDSVYAVVTPYDGRDLGAPVTSNTAVIVNTPPSIDSVSLGTGPFFTDTILTAVPSGWLDVDADAEGYVWRWYVGGALVSGATGAILDGMHFARGDVVRVEARPYDGEDSGNTVSASLTIANSPPVVSAASLVAGTYYTDGTVSLDLASIVAGDADTPESGDTVAYSYRWLVGGAAVPAQTGTTLSGACFVKGDTVACEVTPRDGSADGPPFVTSPVTIANSAPAATAGTFHGFAGFTVSGTLAGTDADGDPLTFAKETDSPEGTVTVASATGAFTFVPAPGFVGTTSFSFTVSDDEGARSPAAGATIVVEQAALVGVGNSSGCAIKAADHGLWCWGDNRAGELGDGTTTLRVSPVREALALSDWAFLDVGGDTACAIRADHTLWCWGNNVAGTAGVGTWTPVYQPTQVGTDRSWVRVSVGQAHACGIEQDESLWCWGLNSSGQVGDNTYVNRNTPQLIGNGYREVGLGSDMSCAIKSDGRLFCWGSNVDGRLGDGTLLSSKVPVQEWLHATDWKYVLGGGSSRHTCALNANGHLHCWGNNASGQIGYETIGGYYGWPHIVDDPLDAGVTSWSWAAVGYAATCAVKASGELFCWGANGHGELGSTTLPNIGHPLQYQAEATWQAHLAMGGKDSSGAGAPGNGAACGFKAGDVACWGGNVHAHLGRGTNAVAYEPAQAQPASAGFLSAMGNMQHVCGITSGNALACWGEGSSGQLGNGYFANQATPAPVAAAGTSLWAWASVGGAHSCATQTDGTLWCWGANTRGQLGDNTTDMRTAPVQESSLATDWGASAAALSLGGEHTCAIKSSGPPHALYCWGANASGQLGDGSSTPRTQPVPIGAAGADWSVAKAGAFHTCAVDGGGALYCWGNNNYGQLGDGSTTARNQVPAAPVAGGPWASVAAGAYHTCAITAGTSPGRLFCWGWHYYGELGIGAGAPNTCGSGVPCAVSPQRVGAATDWAAVFAAYDLTCAINTSGALYCWGSDRFGQVGDGAGADSCGVSRPCRYSPAAVGADVDWAVVYPGYSHACAGKIDGSIYCWGTQEYGQAGDGKGFAVLPLAPLFP